MTPTTVVPASSTRLGRVSRRLRLSARNLAEFWRELRKHPIAVAAGVIILLYFLAAVFASQITTHDPLRGSLRQRLNPPAWQEGGSWE